ncbi:MAG: FAD-dependent oxidoreductase [Hyphomicrobiaceae bacterium]
MTRLAQADVIVVGGGGSGLAAAAEAARLGRSVILLEKNAALGGSTAWSVGSISATGTPQQKARGIVDHPDAHFEDLEVLAGSMANRDNRALRRILVDNTTDMLAWLEGIGLVFAGPNVEPPHRLPRMHNVLPNSRAFPEMLGRHCRALGVDIRLETVAEQLIVANGRIVGVEVRGPQGTYPLSARGGVVLAGGDYSANSEMKAQLAGPETAALEAVNPTATGDAIRLAIAVGAEVVNGDIVRGPILRFIPPTRPSLLRRLPTRRWLALSMRWALNTLPASIQRPFAMSFLTTALGPSRALFDAGAILVNRHGHRFCDELQRPAHAVPAQPDRIAYIVMDSSIAQRFTAWPNYISTAPGIAYAYLDDYRRNRADIFHQARDIAGLADHLAVPAAALQQAIAETTTTSHGQRPGLTKPPFIALGPVKSYVVFTDGGLKVSERLEVLGADGSPLAGLYAAGSTGQGGLLLEGHGHHLGWAFISGRIAGRHAALEIAART